MPSIERIPIREAQEWLKCRTHGSRATSAHGGTGAVFQERRKPDGRFSQQEEAEAALEVEEGADDAIDAVRDYHREKAKEIWPRGASLRCPKCGRTRTASTIELATFLGRVWPTCCGKSMRIGDPPVEELIAEDAEDAEDAEK